MFGNNPKRPPFLADGSTLFVKQIFKTIQGEGPNVGLPAIFIRLGGCNLSCSFCDTDFEEYSEMKLFDILKYVQVLNENKSINLIVITGGEPFRQPIALLCKKLLEHNYVVQIETNGTLYREIPDNVQIICSPKVYNKKYLSIREDLLPRINALKFLISSNIKEYSIIPELGQKKYNIPVFIQPMDQYDDKINQDNKSLAVSIAISKSYRISYQIHKSLNID